ncbi:MAG: hypothetical protein V7637_1859 [Mycobacteriales bacterium]
MTHPVTRPARRPGSGGASGHGGPGDGSRSDGPDRVTREPYTPPYDLVQLHAPDGPLRARVDPTVAAPAEAGPARRPMTFAARSAGGAPPGRLRQFAREYGWRAYAIPLLTVATFLAVMDVARGDGTSTSGNAPASAAAQGGGKGKAGPPPVIKSQGSGIFVDSPPAGDLNAALPATALPPGGQYSLQGGGRFDVVPGNSKVYGTGGPLHRYTVEVEAGVAEDGPAFAAQVERILGDPHSWGNGGRMTLQRVDTGEVDFRVSLTSSLTVRKLCGYTLPFETSCYNGDLNRAVINDARWVRGAVAYGTSVTAYRTYVINHEVGHAFGHGHLQCPKAGALAPVMMQQTLGISTPGVGSCRTNPWPFP